MIRRNFCLLVNPTAGNGRTLHLLKKIEKKLTDLPINFRTAVTKDVEHAKEMAIDAIQKGEYIATMGGDGTTRAIASVLSELQGMLALIPAGRGNDFARTLKLPSDPIAACNVLAYGKERVIDMAQINQQPFLGICSLGFDSLANQLASRSGFIKGRAVYLIAALRALFKWKPIKFKVVIDDYAFEHIGYTVAVANAQSYGGGMFIAPDASIQDGLLDIVLIGNISKLRVLITIPRVFKGAHIDLPGFTILRGRSVCIEADPQYTVYADGDFISAPPAHINIVSKGLRVLVPETNGNR